MELEQAAMDRYRQLYEEAPIAYQEMDTKGRIVSVNQAECSLLGYSEQEMIGRYGWEFITAEDQEASRVGILAKLARTVELRPFVRECRLHDGRSVFVEVHERLVTGADGAVVGIRSALLDVTERHRASLEIIKHRALLHATLQSIGEGVIVTDSVGSVTLMNPAAERLTGWKESDARGVSFERIFLILPRSDEDPLAANGSLSWRLLQKVIVEGAVADSPDGVKILNKDAEIREVSVTISPVCSRPQTVIGAVLVARQKGAPEGATGEFGFHG
jgi:diguanylate cyclase